MVDENNNNQGDIEKPQNSGDLVVGKERDELGMFLPGHEKLGGKPKGYVSPTKLLKEKLSEVKEVRIGDKIEQKTIMAIIVDVFIKLAVNGDLMAIKEIFNRLDGKQPKGEEEEKEKPQTLIDLLASASKVIEEKEREEAIEREEERKREKIEYEKEFKIKYGIQ